MNASTYVPEFPILPSERYGLSLSPSPPYPVSYWLYPDAIWIMTPHLAWLLSLHSLRTVLPVHSNQLVATYTKFIPFISKSIGLCFPACYDDRKFLHQSLTVSLHVIRSVPSHNDDGVSSEAGIPIFPGHITVDLCVYIVYITSNV